MTKNEANTIKFTETRLMRIGKWILGSLLGTVLIYLAAGYAVYQHMERHCEAIRKGMSINEVRQALGDTFVENPVSFSAIKFDGYPLHHYTFPEKSLAKRYAFRFWKSLYLYVIYNPRERVELVIEAFE